MIRLLLACLSLSFLYSCTDSSVLQDFSARETLLGVDVSPNSLVFGPESAVSELIAFQIIGTLPENAPTSLTLSVGMQRGNERFLSSEDFTITREGNQLVATANIQVETGSNAPLTAITSLTYDNGESGDIFINTIPVRSNLGSPPVIDSVSFPAEIIKPATGSTPVLFIAYVSDPDGPENIDIVTMSIFDAEQNPVGAPLRLYDDGGQTDLGNGVRSGDTTANDRAFSRTLQIDNSNTARTLTLRFQATDKSGQLSNVIEQPFTISEP